MFRYNPSAKYEPNRGHYLQILSDKDLYKQTIVVNIDDTFHVRFPNIFVDYPLEEMRIGNKLWTNWNKAPLRLWQTQLNFVLWCASSVCGVSSKHLNYKKHPMVRSLYQFHKYYQVLLSHESGFNAAENPHTNNESFKLCEHDNVPHDPMRYRDEKFCLTYQQGVGWPDDYIGSDSMTHWIIKNLGFTDVGLLRISEITYCRKYSECINSSKSFSK